MRQLSALPQILLQDRHSLQGILGRVLREACTHQLRPLTRSVACFLCWSGREVHRTALFPAFRGQEPPPGVQLPINLVILPASHPSHKAFLWGFLPLGLPVNQERARVGVLQHAIESQVLATRDDQGGGRYWLLDCAAPCTHQSSDAARRSGGALRLNSGGVRYIRLKPAGRAVLQVAP